MAKKAFYEQVVPAKKHVITVRLISKKSKRLVATRVFDCGWETKRKAQDAAMRMRNYIKKNPHGNGFFYDYEVSVADVWTIPEGIK